MDRVHLRPCVRSATLNGYLPLAASVGLDAVRLLERVDINPADLTVPEKWIPAADVTRLLELSATESGTHDFGLRLAELRRLSTLGPLGLVLPAEPTLRAALDLLIRYQRTYNEALQMRVSEENSLATVRVWLEFGEPAPARQGTELAVAALNGILRALRGSDWTPLTTCFAHHPPTELGTHRYVFGSTLKFDHEFSGLVFHAAELDAENKAADPQLRAYTQRFLQSVASPRGSTPADRVRELVEFLLPLGRCSMDQIARTLGVDARTLRRHLTDNDDSFSGIVHGTRAALAERYLPNPRYSLTDISELLGFEAPSAFSRWFRQQFGTSPTQWRTESVVRNG